MFDLLLCEKPSQAKAVAAAIGVTAFKKGYAEGQGYIVTWAIGHVLEYLEPDEYDSKYKRRELADLPIIPSQIKLKPVKEKKGQIAIVKAQLKRARRVIIATDFDNEGEAIARNLLDHCHYNGELKRLKYSTYEREEILEGLRNLLPPSEGVNRFNAQRARSMTDWLTGINFSRLFSLLYQKKHGRTNFTCSYGSVQTPLLKIACIREAAIRNFKPTSYYILSAGLSSQKGNFSARVVLPGSMVNDNGGLSTPDEVNQVAGMLLGKTAEVISFSDKRSNSYAPLPYILSKLYIDAEKHNINPNDAMAALQSLYLGGYVSYPRSDNEYIPFVMKSKVPGIFAHMASREEYSDIIPLCDPTYEGKCWKDVDPNESAHHAIFLTEKPAPNFEGNEAVIYDLIARRSLLQFMGPQENKIRHVELKVNLDGEDFIFIAKSKKETKPGWKAAPFDFESSENHEEDNEDAFDIPEVEVGDRVLISELEPKQKITTKPVRFTIGTLINEMGFASKYVLNDEYKSVLKEKAGIGTEATQGGIVNKEISKGTLVVKGMKIHVPSQVENYINFLPDELTHPDIAALWELLYRGVKGGELTLEELMADIHQYINTVIKNYVG